MSLPTATIASSQTLTATTVLLLLPRAAQTPVVVLWEGQVPSSVRLDIHSSLDVFVRIRRGPAMHGLWEPYRELPSDELPAGSAVVGPVASDRYVQGRFPCTASVFGAVDAVVVVPRDREGRSFERVLIPVPSLDQASSHEFELASESRTESRYRFVRDGQFGLQRKAGPAHD